MSNYTVLHCHTELSNGTTNIDSVTKYEDYIKRASELGMKAIAITEHGNILSFLKKKAILHTQKEHSLSSTYKFLISTFHAEFS